MSTYFESFESGPGGWHGWISNASGPGTLEIRDSAVVCKSPWWVDYNHAPPSGKGYLHILMGLRTLANSTAAHETEVNAVGGFNRFATGAYDTDFRNATVTLRLRGELDLQGAQLLYHVQANVRGRSVTFALTGQPFTVTADWSEQKITLDPDPSAWTCLGTRHDRGDFYGEAPIDEVLRDVNGNMIFVLYPLNIVPRQPVDDDQLHVLRAGEDYLLDQSKLPSGWVMFDSMRITLKR